MAIFKLNFKIAGSTTGSTSYDRFLIIIATGLTSTSDPIKTSTSAFYVTTGTSGQLTDTIYIDCGSYGNPYASCAVVNPTVGFCMSSVQRLSNSSTTYTFTMSAPVPLFASQRLLTIGCMSYWDTYKSNPKILYNSGVTATSGSYQITHTGGTIFDIYSGGSLISNPGKRYYPSSCFMFKKIRHNKVYLGPTVSVNTSATMKIYNNMPSGYPSYYHMYFDIRGGNDRSTSATTVTFMSSSSSNIEVPRTQTVTIPHTKPTTSANDITFIEVHVAGYWGEVDYYSFALHVTDSNGVIIATNAFGSINTFSSQTFIPINSACTIGNVLLTVSQE